MSEVFKAEDFKYIDGTTLGETAKMAALEANKLLKERATVVYGQMHSEISGSFTTSKIPTKGDWAFVHTHKALLVNIQPLEEKKVEVTKQQIRDAVYKARGPIIEYRGSVPPNPRELEERIIDALFGEL